MKKYIVNIGLILLVIVFLVINGYQKKMYSQNINDYESKLSFEKLLSSSRDNSLAWSIENNGAAINPDLIITDEKGVNFTLREIVKSKKLIFRFTELNCNVCVDKQIKILKQFEKKISKSNIAIFTEYSNHRDLVIFKRLNALDLPIYNLHNKMNIKLEAVDTPYFFIVDDRFIAQDFFVPVKEIENYTNKYLKIIGLKHFKI
jgi:hypothetical protein